MKITSVINIDLTRSNTHTFIFFINSDGEGLIMIIKVVEYIFLWFRLGVTANVDLKW